MRPLSLTTAVVVLIFTVSSILLFRLSAPPAMSDSLRDVNVHHVLPPNDASTGDEPRSGEITTNPQPEVATEAPPVQPPSVTPPPNKTEERKARYYATAVASYFHLNSSKHGDEKYSEWLPRLFKRARGPFVIYCSPVECERIREWRRDFPDTTKIIVVDDYWSIPVCADFKADFEFSHTIDPEQKIHNPSLYCMWFFKLYLLNQVAQSNPFDSDFFFYADAGSFRDPNRHFRDFNWPDQSPESHWRTQLTTTAKDHFLLEMVYPYHYLNVANRPVDPEVGSDGHRNASCDLLNTELPDPRIRYNLIAGTFYGGSASLISQYSRNYYALAREWADRKLFIGKDQDLLNYLYERAGYKGIAKQTVIPSYTSMYCGDRWFFFQLSMAARKDSRPPCQPNFQNVPQCLEN